MRQSDVCVGGGASPHYAQNPQSLSSLQVALDTTWHHWQIGGDILYYNEGPAGQVLEVKFNTRENSSVYMRRGDVIENLRFSELWVRSVYLLVGGVALLLVADGPPDRARIFHTGYGDDGLVSTLSGVQTALPLGPLRLQSEADVVIPAGIVTLIVPADPLRRFVIFRSHPANIVDGRWGDALIGAAQGEYIKPGEIVRSDNRDNFYGWSAGPSDMTITLNTEWD